MDWSMPGFSVLYQLPKLAQIHVHWVSDAIQPSHSLSCPSPPTFNLSRHQGLFQWVGSSHQVAKILEFQLQHQSFQCIFRSDPCPSPTPRVHSNSCPLSRWFHPTISASVIPFSSRLQPFPASGSFPVSQLFALGGQTIGVSASTSVLPMNTQDWFPLRWNGLISLPPKGLSRVFSNTTVQKHQFFGAQLSL